MDKYEKLKKIDGRKKYGRFHQRFKHGKTNDAVYIIWQSMKSRCFNPKNKSFKNYGARDIKICKRWLDFSNFYIDFGYQYKKGLSVERINNSGNYEPKNCIWIPMAQQARNKRSTRLITYKGKTLTVTDWEKELGYKPDYLSSKIRKGISFEKAINLKFYERLPKT